MQELSSASVPMAHWEQLQPVLDEAMNELDEPGREAVLLRFFGGQSEYEDIVLAHAVADLDIRTVEGADRQRAIQRQLHVSGAGRFHPGGRDLLREISRRNDNFR